MILGDEDLVQCALWHHIVEPCRIRDIQPSSIDLHLASDFKVPVSLGSCDVMKPQEYIEQKAAPNGTYSIMPHCFVLGATTERVTIPNFLVGRLEGKSSLARLGLFVHVTAGFFDPGFQGYPTLELYNARNVRVILHVGMPICQMSFEQVTKVRRPYGHPDRRSKYMDQGAKPTGSLFFQNRKP